MSRKFDVCVFGGTGFTGARVVQELLRVVHEGSKKWQIAVAGRNPSKLKQVLDGLLGAEAVEVLVANVDVPETLQRMAASTHLVLNCVGPYRLWGEPVVAACVAAGTSYLDVCGEPDFIERMEFKYGEGAAAAGCHIASAVGFDSVPADLGVLFVQRAFPPPALAASVESFLTIHTGRHGACAHAATWESAVLGFAHAGELRELRKRARTAGQQAPPPRPIGPRLRVPAGPTYDERVRAWKVPFPGADASVVRRTQAATAAAGGTGVQYAAYFTVASRWNLALLAVCSALLMRLAAHSWGRALLLAYPGLFSAGVFTRAGPSAAQLASTSFTMTFHAKGFSQGAPATAEAKPDVRVVAQVGGPEPGYVATPIILVQAALTLLEEHERLGPAGVATAGALFRNTTLVERLGAAGVHFSLLSKQAAEPSEGR